MSDLISRSALIDSLNKFESDVHGSAECYSSVTEIVEAIEYVGILIDEQPPVEIPTWTPCSERLPELNEEAFSDDVLVSFENSNHPYIAFYNGVEKKWYTHMSICIGKIVAWQPLPKPYKGE